MPVPDDRRLALVRDAQRDDVLRPHPGAAQRGGDDAGDVAPDLLGVVLDPARTRVVLAVLALGDGDHPAAGLNSRHRVEVVPWSIAATTRSVTARSSVRVPQPRRDLPRRVEQLLGQARHRRAAATEQLLHRALDTQRADHEATTSAHGCGQAADPRPVLPQLTRPTALPGRRQLLGERADGDDGAPGVALQVELVRPGTAIGAKARRHLPTAVACSGSCSPVRRRCGEPSGRKTWWTSSTTGPAGIPRSTSCPALPASESAQFIARERRSWRSHPPPSRRRPGARV